MKKPLFLYPPVYLLLFLAAQNFLHMYFPLYRMWEYKEFAIIAYLLLGVGLLIFLLAQHQFRKQKTTILPYQEPDALITGGIFAFSRNPIYLVMTLVLVAGAITFGSLICFIIAGIFPILIWWRFIRHEEMVLEQAFGETYVAYKEKVRRWF